MVVETWPGSSAAFAMRIRRNKGGPWLDEGPSELGNMPTEEPKEPRPRRFALVPSSVSPGGMRFPVVVVVLLRSPVDFFLTTTRDIRRWIFDSRILFCCTAGANRNSVSVRSGTAKASK